MYEEKWKSFIGEGSLGGYTQGESVTLYHYSRANKETLTLDPAQAESIVASGTTPYATEVASSSVYDLRSDPMGILESSPSDWAPEGTYMVDYNKVFNTIKENYGGVFYSLPSFDVVAWFSPIEVKKTENSNE